MHSLLVSLIRLVVVALPLARLFTSLPKGEQHVWWAFPIAEACGFVAAVVLMKGLVREKPEALQ